MARLIPVVRQNGSQVYCEHIGWTETPLFEVAPGYPLAGSRGSDVDLFNLVGSIRVDWTEEAVLETGQIRQARVTLDLA